MTSPLAVVLGVGPLLGAAVVRRIAREGIRVAMVGKDRGFLDEQARAIPETRAFLMDLSEPGASKMVLHQIQMELGPVQVLIYHASSGTRGTASSLNPEQLQRDLRMDATAPLEAVQMVLPDMRRSGQGTILFTGGGLALKPQADMASASMGKAALRQLALCLADELAPEGIHVATVTIAGFVQRNSAFNPDRVAEAYWQLHVEPRENWRYEVVLRP